MALRADHAARLRIQPRRADDRPVPGWVVPAAVPGDMGAAGSVTAFACRAEIGPRGRVCLRGRLVVVFLLADVAPETVLVPLLNGSLIVLVRADDLHVVEPGSTFDIPTRREDDDPALFDGREVVLDAAAAERVLDAMFARRAGDVRFGDVVRAVGHPQLERLPVKRDPGPREVPFDARGGRGLNHLAVAGARPAVVHVLVARCAHACTDQRRLTRTWRAVSLALCRSAH